MDLERLERVADFEWERRKEINRVLAFEWGIALLLIGSTPVLIRAFSALWHGARTVYILVGIVDCFAVLTQVTCLLRVWHGHTSGYLPEATEMEKALIEFREYYNDERIKSFEGIGTEREAEQRAQAAFEENYHEAMLVIASKNHRTNNSRLGQVTIARTAAIVAAMSSGVLWSLSFVSSGTEMMLALLLLIGVALMASLVFYLTSGVSDDRIEKNESSGDCERNAERGDC